MHLHLAHFLNGDDPLIDSVDELAADGILGVETYYLRFRPWDAAACQCLREELDRTGVRAYSVHAPFGPDFNIADADPLARLTAIESRSESAVSDVMAVCAESLKPLDELAAELGLELAVENMLPAHVLSDFEALRELVLSLDSPRVGVCLDTGHAHLTGGLKRAVEVFGELISHVHLQDNNGDADRHLLPSYGAIPWDGFAGTLAALGYDRPLTIEAFVPSDLARRNVIPTVRRALGL